MEEMITRIGGVTLDRRFSGGEDSYSEGDQVEELLLEAFRTGADTDEILRRDGRWPVLYQLSPERKNLLEVMDLRPSDRVELALVGVIKGTRYYPEKARRLFIYKNKNGRVRAMWMGSRVGGPIDDFRFVDGRIRVLGHTTDGKYVVAEYQWQGFGLEFIRYLCQNEDEAVARRFFSE